MHEFIHHKAVRMHVHVPYTVELSILRMQLHAASKVSYYCGYTL